MRMNAWLRLFFLFVVAQALLLGRELLWPDLVAATLPWPASPLNARFIAALYWMGALSSLFCLLARDYSEVRITLIEVGFVTGALLLLTLPHLGEFTAETFPYRWMIFYTIDPLVVAWIAWRLRGRDPAPSGRNALAPLFIAYAGLLSVAGAVLLLAPTFAAQLWPWALPPILGQVYSMFFFTFALGGIIAARDPRWASVWVYLAANLLMFVLILGVSLFHADRFVPGMRTWLWYALFLAGALAFAAALLRRLRTFPAQEAAV